MKALCAAVMLLLTVGCGRPCFDAMVEAGYPAHCITVFSDGNGGVGCFYDEAACFGEAIDPLCLSPDGGADLCADGGVRTPVESCEASMNAQGRIEAVTWAEAVKGTSISLSVDHESGDAVVTANDDGGSATYAATVKHSAPGVLELDIISKGAAKVEVGAGWVSVEVDGRKHQARCRVH